MKDYRRTTRFGGMFTFGLALVTVALFLPGNSASAQSDPEIDILIGSTTGQPGGQVDIDVDIETNGAEPSVIVLTLLYDATKLSFVEVVRGESAIQAEKIVDTNNEPGQLGIIIWGGRTFLKNGTLFTVTFAIRSVAPSGVLTVAGDGSESAVDANAGRILVNIEPGSITVKQPFDILSRCGAQSKIVYDNVENGAVTSDTPEADAGIFLAMAAVLGMKYASRRRKKK